MKIQFRKRTADGENSFFLNAGVLAGGGLASIIISIALAPVISRLFEPEAYGSFAVVNAVAVNITVMAMMGFQNAIITPKSKSGFIDLVGLCFMLLATAVLVTSACLILLKFLDLLNEGIADFWYIIPLLVLLSGSLQIVSYCSIRANDFKRNSLGRVLGICTSKAVNLGYGIAHGSNAVGLFLGEILLSVVNILLLLKKRVLIPVLLGIRRVNIYRLKRSSLEYKNFPLFNLPSSWLRITLTQLPIYFLAAYYIDSDVGALSLSNSLLNVPLVVIGQSMATALFRKGVEISNAKSGSLSVLVLKSTIVIFSISVIPFAFLFAFGDLLTILFLGEEWKVAGSFVRVQAFSNLASILLYSLWSMYLVIRKEKYRLAMSLLHCFLISAYFIFYPKIDAIKYVEGYATLNVFIQLLVIGHIFHKVGIKFSKSLFIILSMFFVALFCGYIFTYFRNFLGY